MGLYGRYIVPPLTNLACGAEPIRQQRQRIVPHASGVVLELGFGAGLNLPHYDRTTVTKLFALEPAPGMLARARKTVRDSDLPVEILAETAETLSLPPASVDTVVVTYSLCTIPNAVAALEAARRALRPGGRLLFCEHGRSPDVAVQRTQARIEPFWRIIGGGCHVGRDIPALIAAGGFKIETLETAYLEGAPKWSGFNYWGMAKASRRIG
jgi:SAM-dependent methyltransferase